MNTVRAIQKLNQRELEAGINPEGSWHTDYRDTAFIYIGGLPFELSEGDIITLFSQYGEPVWIKLARDRETGKSRGFCWLKYEDQRSTDLAVDNLGGATVMGRVLRVDHTRYKPKDDEDMRDNTMGEPVEDEGEKRRKRRRTDSPSESESEEERPMLKEEIELEKLIRDLDEDDPMKPSMVRRKQEEVDAALKKWKKARAKEKGKKHRSRHHHRDRSRSRNRERKAIKDREEDDYPSKSRRRRDSSSDEERYSRRRREERKRSRSRRRDGSRHRDDRHRRHHSSDAEERHSRRKHSPRRDRSPDAQPDR